MPHEIAAPWSTDVPIEEWTNTDFERRVKTANVYDADGSVENLLDDLAELEGADQRAIGDRAIRMYTAHVIDSHEEFSGIRERYDVNVLLPPKRYDKRPQNIGFSLKPKDSHDKHSIGITIPPTVYEIMGELVDSDVLEVRTRNAFMADALHWYSGIE